MVLTPAQKQAAYRDRQKQGIQLRHKRIVNDEGRECAYGGHGNCGHQFKPWSEYGPGNGPHGRERRCKDCMVTKALEYIKREPTEAQQRRSARQAAYQQTPIGKDVSRRARLKYRYGITAEQYDWLGEQQGWLCYFCGLEETVVHHATGKVMRLGVEHSHECDQGHVPAKACRHCVRGLACYNCNSVSISRAERSPVLRPRVEDLLARRPLLALAA